MDRGKVTYVYDGLQRGAIANHLLKQMINMGTPSRITVEWEPVDQFDIVPDVNQSEYYQFLSEDAKEPEEYGAN